MTQNASADPAAPVDDDLSVAHRIAAGDRFAFELLMRRYNRRLYRLARATLRHDADAEDALQDSYISAYRSIEQFRGDSTLFTWLCRLVLNECFGRLRREARRQRIIPMADPNFEIDLDAMSGCDVDTPYDLAARAEMRAYLEKALDEMPATFRIVFMLRSIEEMSVEETAQCLGIPEETVRSRHFRAKKLMRASLARDLDLAGRDLFEFGGAQCDRVVSKVLASVST
jgi:RNA polymerase sigma-70 factor (ECF subfamily)